MAVICAGLEKQELNKNLYGQNFCSQFCFLTADAAEKAVVYDENIFFLDLSDYKCRY